MRRARLMSAVFVIAFVLLLLDGAALIWLGQLWGRLLVVVAGVLFLVASVAVAFWHRTWMKDLEAIEIAKRERRQSIDDLRSVLEDAHRRRN